MISLDTLVITSVQKNDIPRVDGHFEYNGLKIYVCFRPCLIEFLDVLVQNFELILWTTAATEYSLKLASIIDSKPHKYFSHLLDISHCQFSEDKVLNVKNLEVLLSNRRID